MDQFRLYNMRFINLFSYKVNDSLALKQHESLMNQVRQIILDHYGLQPQKNGLVKCQILWKLEDSCRDVKIWRHNLDLTPPMCFMLATVLVALFWRTMFLVISILIFASKWIKNCFLHLLFINIKEITL